MSIEKNKQVIIGFHDDVINGLQFDRVPAYMHADMRHLRGAIGYTLSQMDPAGVATLKPLEGHTRFIEATRLLRAQFPEWHSTIEEVIAEGDRVVTRCIVRGRHRGGPFLTSPDTSRPFELPQIIIQQVVDGRIKSVFALSDELGFWRALGVVLPGAGDTFHGK
jgi:predicted ester cyclase